MDCSTKNFMIKVIQTLDKIYCEYDNDLKDLYIYNLKKNIKLIHIIRNMYIFILEKRYNNKINTKTNNFVIDNKVMNKKMSMSHLSGEINLCTSIINEIEKLKY